MKYLKHIFVLLLLVNLNLVQAANADFPGRKKFSDVKVYSLAQLKNNLNKVVVVDARSKLEFETLRIKGAINIPLASKTFKQQLKALRKKTLKPIVFYCNGITCFKSYLAARKARFAGVKNVFAYDEGLFAWTKKYPDMAALMGKSPVNLNKIISKTAFNKRCLEPTTFANLAFKTGKKAMIIDVRDKYQRGAAGFFPGQELWASLDEKEKIDRIIKQAARDKQTLFIYDEVGKQVRWLQYALEKHSVKNYYFMKKGAKAYFNEMMQDFRSTGTSL